ncbi:hypothetical protein [Dactylosporangium sp. CA-233914]
MQYLISVIDDGTGPATPKEAPDLGVALKLAADGSKACNRKIEVRPFLSA